MNIPGMPPELMKQLLKAQQQGLPVQMVPTGEEGDSNAETPQKPTNQAINPLPMGTESLKQLRARSECPIPGESNTFHDLTRKLTVMDDNEDLLDHLGQGLAAILGADSYCKKHHTERTVVIFDDDEVLKNLHKEAMEKKAEFEKRKQELDSLAVVTNTLIRQRWSKAVELYGLNVDDRFYQIDEEEGKIIELSLKCPECKGKVRVRKARQQLTQILVSRETKRARAEAAEKQGENNDNGGEERPTGAPTQDTDEGGEVSVEEQKVPSVPSDGGSADNNGDTGSEVAE